MLKYIASAALLGASAILSAQTICESGFADIYPCSGIDMLSHLEIADIGGGENMNDIWGWTSNSGREIVIAGRSSGTAFVDITDPLNPIYLGNLPTHSNNSLWRDIKVYNNHAFIVSEAGGHGMQVMDLNEVINASNPPNQFTESAYYGGFGHCHNIAINEESGYAYAVGTGNFAGGLEIIDISNPLEPTLVGGFEGGGYVHDAQIVNYIGPDADHTGKELAFCCNGGSFVIADVTVKDDVMAISTNYYENQSYVHQGWLTEDQRYFLQNDETDEVNFGFNTRTHIWDVLDLDNPYYMGYYEGPVTSSDHNLYVKGSHAYMSNYYSGLRIVDISDIANANLSEVAYFDILPALNVAGYSGSWSNYPYFESGNIAVTSMPGGLFIVKVQDGLFTDIAETKTNTPELSVGPNPAVDQLNITWTGLEINSTLFVYSANGQLTKSLPVFNNNGSMHVEISDLASGMYFLKSSDSSFPGKSFLVR